VVSHSQCVLESGESLSVFTGYALFAAMTDFGSF